ncbi:UNVERIFIED_CONTAM: hypothetical protein K2H54_064181 [Gekko kuhli]
MDAVHLEQETPEHLVCVKIEVDEKPPVLEDFSFQEIPEHLNWVKTEVDEKLTVLEDPSCQIFPIHLFFQWSDSQGPVIIKHIQA